MSGPRYTHPAQALAEIARDNMQDDLNALIRVYVTEQAGSGWAGDVDPMVSMVWDQALVGVLRQLIENGEQPEPISADSIAVGDRIDLVAEDGGRCYEPRDVEAIVSGSVNVTVEFTDEQPAAVFAFDERVWRIGYGEPGEEPRPVWLSRQARALLAGLLDPDSREEELNTGDGQVFAPTEIWDEVKAALPPSVYRDALNEEGQIA